MQEFSLHNCWEYKKRTRKAWLQLCDISEWNNPTAITLTFKNFSGTNDASKYKNDRKNEQTVKHLLNVVNRKIFKKQFRKFPNARIRFIGFKEGQGDGCHYHGCVERPDCISAENFARLISSSWRSLRFGNHQLEIVSCYDAAGWLDYISKHRTKSGEFGDSFDVENFYNPSIPKLQRPASLEEVAAAASAESTFTALDLNCATSGFDPMKVLLARGSP